MRTDVLLKEDDLDIAGGDFVIGPADLQHVYLVLRTHPGNWKQFPLVGYGEEKLLNGPLDGQQRRDIQLALQADGYNPRELTVSATGVNIRL